MTLAELRALAAQLDGTFSDEQLERLLPLVQALYDGMAQLDAIDLDGLTPEPIFRAAWDTDDAGRE